MFKFFWSRATAKANDTRDWRHDPMEHPALRQMNLRELADLPMVAEVPMRVKWEKVADGCRESVGQQHQAACGAS